jgi:hypothetical protein
MNLVGMLRALLSAHLDAETRQALLRAARGESGSEIEAALETLIHALGILDETGAVDEVRVNALLDDLGLEPECEL